jgi:hypothetical protein
LELLDLAAQYVVARSVAVAAKLVVEALPA